MKITIKKYTWLLIFLYSYSYGQIEQYDYKRELKGVSEQWHKIILPNEIFGKVSQNLSDIRIYGVTEKNDTVESAYILQQAIEKVFKNEIKYKIINTSHNENGYYFTFEIPSKKTINQINLEFKERNFDWRIKLEGSQNQQEWFTIVQDYRILSIKNENTNYQFTKLAFTNSNYRYFRVLIDSKEKPTLNSTSITQQIITRGVEREYPTKSIEAKENKSSKQTEIEVELELPVPVSSIKIAVNETFDYYRPLTVKYLADSFNTEQGWKYTYNTLTSGTLNSIEENEFKFSSKTLRKLKIIIHNQDNQALNVESIQVQGDVHEILARFTEPATYFLTYGSNNSSRAQYDISRFKKNIPENITSIKIGDEIIIQKEEEPVTSPLFENKNWLWGIMGIIIVLLGGFSLKMMKKN